MNSKSLLIMMCFLAAIILGPQILAQPSNAVTLTAEVDITPKTLNLDSNGKWITAKIGLPEGYNISNIVISAVLLEGLFKAEWGEIEEEKLVVKFDASSVRDYLWENLYHMGLKREFVELTVTGQLKDGTSFVSSDTIAIIYPRF